jgi:hypothetical protein
MINRHIAPQVFILNGIWSILIRDWNPGEIFKCTNQAFSTSVAMTSHKHKHGSWKTTVAQTLCKCSRMTIVSSDIKWISSDAFEFENNTKQSIKIEPATKKKLGMVNVINQLQHFILCNIVCYLAVKSNIDRGFRTWTILLFSGA